MKDDKFASGVTCLPYECRHNPRRDLFQPSCVRFENGETLFEFVVPFVEMREWRANPNHCVAAPDFHMPRDRVI